MAEAPNHHELQEELNLLIEEWKRSRSSSSSLRILVVGGVGRGKSALVNTLVGGKAVAEEHSDDNGSSKVQTYCEVVNGVNVTIFDTPGLYSSAGDEHAKQTLREIATETGEEGVHLVLFCVSMVDRVAADDKKTMKLLTLQYGKAMWKNALFILTFVNEVKLPQRHRSPATQHQLTLESYFLSQSSEYARTLSGALREAGVAEIICQGVPVIPVGYDDCKLPDCEDWFDRFWKEAFKRAKVTGVISLLRNMRQIEGTARGRSISWKWKAVIAGLIAIGIGGYVAYNYARLSGTIAGILIFSSVAFLFPLDFPWHFRWI